MIFDTVGSKDYEPSALPPFCKSSLYYKQTQTRSGRGVKNGAVWLSDCFSLGVGKINSFATLPPFIFPSV